jgi:hypothetical protein
MRRLPPAGISHLRKEANVSRFLARVALLAAGIASVLVASPGSLAYATVHGARVEVSAARLSCHAAMTNRHPRDYTSTGIKVRTAPFAHIRTVAHYKTTNHPKTRQANANGRRTVWYYISGATPGFRVVVDVFVSKHGRRGSCSTAFTPRA